MQRESATIGFSHSVDGCQSVLNVTPKVRWRCRCPGRLLEASCHFAASVPPDPVASVCFFAQRKKKKNQALSWHPWFPKISSFRCFQVARLLSSVGLQTLATHSFRGKSRLRTRGVFFFSLSLSSGSGYCGAAALDAAVSICFLVAFFCIRPHGIAIPLCDLRRVPQHLTLLAQNSILFFWKWGFRGSKEKNKLCSVSGEM